MEIKVEENYNTFIKFLTDNVKRDGLDKLIKYLNNSDIKTAPASTKYHNAFEGGLVLHCLNVYDRLLKIMNTIYPNNSCPYSTETLTLVALLHDISKVNLYEITFRNVKDESGNWTKIPVYQVKDAKHRFIYGSHAMNSVYMIKTFLPLSYEEEMAILYHMGGFDLTEDTISIKNIANAFVKSPLALLLHQADQQATFMIEGEIVNE